MALLTDAESEALHGSVPAAVHALHALKHERDFVVRVNDPINNMVSRVLDESVAQFPILDQRLFGCSACARGFEPFYLQPSALDRR